MAGTYKCGPNAIDTYSDRKRYYGDSKDVIVHEITGSGVITSCNGESASFSWIDRYDKIDVNITELGDECFSKGTVVSVTLPKRLQKIGNECFRWSEITQISLPDSLKEIGHNNFPSTLKHINIPAKLKNFPTDNIQRCKEMESVYVSENNKYYKSIDGILYNYDVTEILLCPRGKSGKVIIPSTVKRIAEKCFEKCSKITMIDLPRGVEFIGDYAFSELTLDRLIIPNTVKTVGIGCFYETTINRTFRFPPSITELPSYCFFKAEIPSTNFIKNVEVIGDNCFEVWYSSSLPEYLNLTKIKHIGELAFEGNKNTEVIELASSLTHIGESAFKSTAGDIKFVFLSIVPVKLPYKAFDDISDNAILYIPERTKFLFENTAPWSSFKNIEEFSLDKSFSKGNKKVSDEHLYARLNSIANSIRNADRVYLKEILNEIALSYKYVDNDKDYDAAMELIKYNRKFHPALIPDLEKEMCAEWTNIYRLKLADTFIFDLCAAPISLPVEGTQEYIEQEAIKELPVMSEFNIEPLDITQNMTGDVEVHCTDILRHLQNELSVAECRIKVAVSWFTNFALFKQIKEFAKKGLDIHLIINNDSVNNGGYCLDFNELIEAGVHISLVEYPHLIHHKFCIIDDKVVINGSYNWTRFSGRNYENIMIFRDNEYVTECFNNEFERMLLNVEHKDVEVMPNTVPQRPEYDRYAFKQYITEELDAEARETSEQRDKITALQKAAKLNPKYLEKLNPNAKEEFEEEFKVIEQSAIMTKDIAAMAQGRPIQSASATSASASQNANRQITLPVVTEKEKSIVEKIKATDLFMVLDVSVSMDDTYDAGHVYNITKKAVSAALAVSETQEMSLWKFGDDSTFVDNIGVANLADINKVKCMNTGTELNSFIVNANDSIKDGSLVIIFTDDDGDSIQGAIDGMKSRKKVFWQIIVLGDHDEISSAIRRCPNISLVCMDDYASMTDSEINQALLKNYIKWKKK